MVTQVSSANSNYVSNNKPNSNQQSFQEVFSKAAGYDISQLNTASSNSGMGLLNKPLILPSMHNLQMMAAQLEEDLSEFLRYAGIPSNPPFDIEMDYNNNSVIIRGDRNDADEIAKSLNENPAIKEMIHQISAIGSHVINIADSMPFQKEYFASDNPDSVVRKYSYLFDDNRKMHTFSLRYEKGILQILSDDKKFDLDY